MKSTRLFNGADPAPSSVSGRSTLRLARALTLGFVPIVLFSALEGGCPCKMHGAKTTLRFPKTQVLYVPATAHVSGAAETLWRTDAEVHGNGENAAVCSVGLLKRDQENPEPEKATFVLEPGRSRRFEDLLGSEFDFTGAAALIVTCTEGDISITSRTYNDTEDGTYGQFIGGVAMNRSIGVGQQGRIIQLSHNRSDDEGSRTNLGLVNTSLRATTVMIELFDASDGASLGIVTRQLGVREYQQIGRVFEQVTDGDVDQGFAVVSTSSSPVFAYASVVDNRTGDPVYIPAYVLSEDDPTVTRPPKVLSSDDIYITAVAHSAGAGNTTWRTDVDLHNPGTTEVQAEIELWVRDQANTNPLTAPVTVPAGLSVRLDDALASEFGFDGSAALNISATGGELLVSSRTYNLTPEGTYGQFIGGVGADEALGIEHEGLLMQLIHTPAKDDGFRTNLGLVNLADHEISVTMQLFDGDGQLVGTLIRDLWARQYVQINRVYSQVTENAVEVGYIVVTSTTEGAEYLAYASVVDNRTGDPIYIPAIRRDTRDGPSATMGAFQTTKTIIDLLMMNSLQTQTFVNRLAEEGLEPMLDQLSQAPYATRTENGLRFDFGNGLTLDDRIVRQGALELSYSNLVVDGDAIHVEYEVLIDAYGENGLLVPFDTLSWTLDVDNSGQSFVATVSMQGEGDGTVVDGAFEVNPAACDAFPTGQSVTYQLGEESRTFTFDPTCSPFYAYDIDTPIRYNLTVPVPDCTGTDGEFGIIMLNDNGRLVMDPCFFNEGEQLWGTVSPTNMEFSVHAIDGFWTGHERRVTGTYQGSAVEPGGPYEGRFSFHLESYRDGELECVREGTMDLAPVTLCTDQGTCIGYNGCTDWS